MDIVNLLQGSQPWHDMRDLYRVASEASIMMGVSPQCTRQELIRLKSTGNKKEYSDFVQKVIFERGHEVEAKARAIAEKIIDDDLYPVTGVNDAVKMLASFDGITMDQSTVWECKQWNEKKAEIVRSGKIPKEDYYQCVQQMIVSGANRHIYMVTDGTEENTVYTIQNADYFAPDAPKLIACWDQFDADVKEYQHVEIVEPPVGKAPDDLPSLVLQVSGQVKESNLSQFKEHTLAVFSAINRELITDDDFANAEKTVKWCSAVESRLDLAKEYALSQTADIKRAFDAINEMQEQARQVRLELSKLVKRRKDDRRSEIMTDAKLRQAQHEQQMNNLLPAGFKIPPVNADYAAAMKGKRTITSLVDACEQVLSEAKLEINESYSLMAKNIEVLDKQGKGYQNLFADASQIILKPTEDLKNLINSRIADFKAAQAERLEKEREKIRQEEAAKLEAEAKKKEREQAEIERQKQLEIDAENKRLIEAEREKVRQESEQKAKAQQDEMPVASEPVPEIKEERIIHGRPTEAQILGVVAQHFGVSESTALEWIVEFDARKINKSIKELLEEYI